MNSESCDHSLERNCRVIAIIPAGTSLLFIYSMDLHPS
jgi:hypothetical protein